MDLDLRLTCMQGLPGFQASGCVGGRDQSALSITKNLQVFSPGRQWNRLLKRYEIPVGSASVNNCLFFGRYSGNGISNFDENGVFRRYDGGGQFICSLDGFFTPDMLYTGSFIPESVKYDEKNARFSLSYAEDFKIVDENDLVFMGAYHQHFGHCLVESLVRFWFLLTLSNSERKKKKFIFFQGWGSENSPLVDFMTWLDIPQENIIICNENVLFKTLTIPSFAWRPWNGWDIYLSPQFFAPLHVIGEIAAKYSKLDGIGRKIYLSRRERNDAKTKMNSRPLRKTTELALEEDIVKRGFDVVHPEDLQLIDQIALVSRSSHIVGPGGSAHHLAAFAYQAEAQIILTHEAFWMGGNDSVFSWDKPSKLSYVFGQQMGSRDASALTAEWDFSMDDWGRAAAASGL